MTRCRNWRITDNASPTEKLHKDNDLQNATQKLNIEKYEPQKKKSAVNGMNYVPGIWLPFWYLHTLLFRDNYLYQHLSDDCDHSYMVGWCTYTYMISFITDKLESSISMSGEIHQIQLTVNRSVIYSPCILVSSINNTDHHETTEILLWKVLKS